MKKYNFKDPAEFERLEDAAIDGQLDYSDFPPEEYKYFSQLAKLGHLNRHKGWDVDLCEQKQEEYRERYYKHCEDRDSRLNYWREKQKVLIRGSKALRELEHSRDVQTALSAALEALEAVRDEPGLKKRILKNLEESK